MRRQKRIDLIRDYRLLDLVTGGSGGEWNVRVSADSLYRSVSGTLTLLPDCRTRTLIQIVTSQVNAASGAELQQGSVCSVYRRKKSSGEFSAKGR